MSSLVNIYINNNLFVSDSIDVGVETLITWNYQSEPIVTTDGDMHTESIRLLSQKGFEIRIGEHDNDLGTSSFLGDIVQTSLENSFSASFLVDIRTLTRGKSYYGQLRIRDEIDRIGSWVIFKFRYNKLPAITSAVISPENPGLFSDLRVDYSLSDSTPANATVKIKWFNSGLEHKDLEDAITVGRGVLRYGDEWMAQLRVFDGVQYGATFITNPVLVATSSPIVTDAVILPSNPNENDILFLDYDFSGEKDEKNSEIKWIVNGAEVVDSANSKYARIDLSSGDTVRCEISPYDGVTFGSSVSSPEVTIVSSSFVVSNIQIDGKTEPQNIDAYHPVVSWDLFTPKNKECKFISIKIGSFFGADNILSKTIAITSSNEYPIPFNILSGGRDYYISVSASDTEVFDKYYFSKFSTAGKIWSNKASNQTGWLVDVVVEIIGVNNSSVGEKEDPRQFIRIADGTKFAEIKIFQNKIGLFSEENIYSDVIDMSGARTISISGRDKDIKIYIDRLLVIDGTLKLTQNTNERFLQFGTQSQHKLDIRYYSVSYSVDGPVFFDTGITVDYSFYPFLEIPNMSFTGSTNHIEGDKKEIFVSAMDNKNENSKIYKIDDSKKKYLLHTTPRTISPICSFSSSPNGSITGLNHSRGISFIKNYAVPNWDYSADFSTDSGILSLQTDWKLTENIGKNIASASKAGIEIDSSALNIGSVNKT